MWVDSEVPPSGQLCYRGGGIVVRRGEEDDKFWRPDDAYIYIRNMIHSARGPLSHILLYKT